MREIAIPRSAQQERLALTSGERNAARVGKSGGQEIVIEARARGGRRRHGGKPSKRAHVLLVILSAIATPQWRNRLRRRRYG